MVFQHIPEFLELVNCDPDTPSVGIDFPFLSDSLLVLITGLGYFSEQAFESMHHDVKVSHKLYDMINFII